ncbi:hypothetical protein [Roseomonas mucosa]
MSLLMLLRRMQGSDRETAPLWTDLEGREITTHGFRSTFRQWAAECTSHPHEVAEAALGHVTGSAVSRAYQRSDHLERRKVLMAEWAGQLTSGSPRRSNR